MIETTTLLWINLVAFLCYIPVVCYLDIKYREVDPRYWIPLVVVCLPILLYTIMWELVPWYSLVISGVMILIFHSAMRLRCLEGADFLFLSLISLFWVVTPVGWVHGLMQIQFYIFFAFASAITAIYILMYNIMNGNDWDILKMMSEYPCGFPYMITISIAFLMSVVLG